VTSEQQAADIELDEAAQAYVRGLIDSAAHLRIPELFAEEHQDALYRVPNREGVNVVVLRTTALSEQQLTSLMKFRLAQYVAVNFIDAAMVYETRMEHEPLSGVSPGDVHAIAGSVETGEILCYAALKAPPGAPAGTTLRRKDRPLFGVEQIHGWGIYNRLRVLPDLPLSKVRELGRFVKNQRLHTFDALGLRGPVEVGVALFRALAGPLRIEVDAIIGDLEEGVAKQNLEYFCAPLVVIHGTVPYEGEASYFFPRYQLKTVYPFAALATDISTEMLARLDAIEAGLRLPGKEGLLALLKLKGDAHSAKSSLEPPAGLDALAEAQLPQKGVAMGTRRQLLDAGERLRSVDLFSGLSPAEATVLGTFMERQTVPEGTIVIREGDIGDDLFVIESGEAEVRVGGAGGRPLVVAHYGPGDYFGEIALLTGEERMADVVALTPMTLLRLTKDAFTRYLAHATEVESRLTRTATSRTRDTMRKMASER